MATINISESSTSNYPWTSTTTPIICGYAISDSVILIGYNGKLYTFDTGSGSFTLRKDYGTYGKVYQIRKVRGHIYVVYSTQSGSYVRIYLDRINTSTWAAESTLQTAFSAAGQFGYIGRVLWPTDNLMIGFDTRIGTTTKVQSLVIIYFTDDIISSTVSTNETNTYFPSQAFNNLLYYGAWYTPAYDGFYNSITTYVDKIVTFPALTGGTFTTKTSTGFASGSVSKIIPFEDDSALIINNDSIYTYSFTTGVLASSGITLSKSIVALNELVNLGNEWFFFSGDKVIKIGVITYDLTYTIKDNSGETVRATIIHAAPLTKIKFDNVGSSTSVDYTLTTITGTLTGTYQTEVPEGYHLAGYATSPGINIVRYKTNEEITVDIDTDFTLYEVFEIYNPPENTFDINLYENTAEPNRVDKTSFLTSVGTLSGALRDECSVINPSIVIYYDHVPDFNYVYIQTFGRFYFVRGITSVRKNLWRIDLDCDVLMTYKSGILALSAVIGRQEFDYNADLVDSELPVEKEVSVTVDEISSTAFSTEATGANVYNYVLTVVGS